MAFAKGAGGATVTYNGSAITAYCDAPSIGAQVADLDVTTLSSTGVARIPGLPDWSFDVGGPWDSTFHGIFGPDLVTPGTLRTLVVVVTGVTFTWTSLTYASSLKIDVKPNDAHRWSGTISVSGVPTVT
jgi:hypothetical protein